MDSRKDLQRMDSEVLDTYHSWWFGVDLPWLRQSRTCYGLWFMPHTMKLALDSRSLEWILLLPYRKILEVKMRIMIKGNVWKNTEDEILKAIVMKYGSEAETPKSKKSEGSSNAQSSSVAASKPKKPVYSWFRFYPSDEELVLHYLYKKITNEEVLKGTLMEIDLHTCEPWQLPDLAPIWITLLTLLLPIHLPPQISLSDPSRHGSCQRSDRHERSSHPFEEAYYDRFCSYESKFQNPCFESDHTLKVWSMDGLSDNMTMPINLKAKVVVAAHDKDINSVAVAPNDSLVCSGSQDHTTCVWRLPDLVSVVVFKGHKRGIWSVEFSPVDQCVVTASGDKTIRIWAISDGSCLKTFKGHTSSVLRALFVTRGTQIVSCGMRLSVADFVLYNILVVEKARIRRIIEAEGNHTLTCVVMPLLEEGVVKGQELENVVSDADYTKAIQIAFELRRPHRLFELFAELCRKRVAENHMDRALKGLGEFSASFLQ
ncbi:hypothetical protein JHK82_033361 [Glycine max]|nr:hypothetical protein JHK82_033361 [Glycine max]